MNCGAIKEILGKQISRVVITRNERNDRAGPTSQIFLFFTDGTFIEIYSNGMIEPTKSLRQDGGPFLEKLRNDQFAIVCQIGFEE